MSRKLGKFSGDRGIFGLERKWMAWNPYIGDSFRF
jgi:hypothetical protein